MSRLTNYQDVAGSEIFMSECGSYGYKLSVAVNHELDLDTLNMLRRATEKVDEILQRSIYNTEPRKTERAEETVRERTQLLATFGDTLCFAEGLPNEYCSKVCCEHRPWYWVTTKIGHFKIGWRKRVIVIEWDRTLCKTNAETLFPDVRSTKYKQGIHAYSYEDAKEYIKRIIEEAEDNHG